MPNQYVRKATADRGGSSKKHLKNVREDLQNRGMTIHRAYFIHIIPRKTLGRSLKQNNCTKGPMGPLSTFGADIDKSISKACSKEAFL